MDFKTFKTAIFQAAQQAGLTDYEVYYQTCQSTVATAYKDEINEFSASTEGGVCFRCIYGGKMGYVSTESLDSARAEDLVRWAMDNAAVLEAEEEVFLAQGGQEYRKWSGKNYKLPTTAELIELVLQAQNALYRAGAVDGTMVRGVAECNTIAISNSKGLDVETKVNICALILNVVVGTEEKASDYTIKVGAPDSFDCKAIAEKVTASAKAKLGGSVPGTGTMPVIFTPKAMADLLSNFASVFSAGAAQKGLSRLGDKEGQVIAAPCVTVTDDPCHPDSPIPMVFDGEGSPTKKKTVIEGGVLQTLLYNLKTAKVAGKKTTGNGAKTGFDSVVGTAPFALSLSGGDVTEQELIAMAGDGVYIESLAGLHAGTNAVTGDFSLQSQGFLIEGGKKTVPIKGFTVAGNFYQLLKNIRALADNSCLPMPIGMTTFGAPSTLVDGLTVAGK